MLSTFLLELVALAGPLSSRPHGTYVAPCSQPRLTGGQAFTIARTAAADSTLVEDKVVAFRFEAQPVAIGSRCLLAVALSWDGQHSGAVVVTDSTHNVLFSDTTYRDAHQLTITPRGRIVFVYNSVWGSGLWQTKGVALCPVSQDSWIECVELVLDYRVSVIGHDEPGYFGQAGSMVVVGDTIVWQRMDTIQAYARARSSEYRNLGSVKIPIP